MAILTASTSLSDIFTLTLCIFSNSFFIGNLWLSHVCIQFKLSFHPIHQNFKLQLTHTSNNSLSCISIRFNSKSWIFFSQSLQSKPQFFLIRFCHWHASEEVSQLFHLIA